ncbi:hypothetical protein GCM10023144_47730 [Pigmentiphaga soli]|uniref:PepSY domain-containing protein n=1 Tax=Pigmentiphaga soli TaxID=1007095 RepID=A0ABP8HTL1_9BURK
MSVPRCGQDEAARARNTFAGPTGPRRSGPVAALRPLALSIPLALAGLPVLPGLWPAAALAQAASRQYDIPAGSLTDAKGVTPLTSRMFTPLLVDAGTGEPAALLDMPWYLRALELSRPLHFGDYGGLPLKLIWVLLDLATIAVLGSGLYLWLARRRALHARRAHRGKQKGLAQNR